MSNSSPPNATNDTSPVNACGLLKSDYTGSKSTLCTGCGHDSISQHIISACFSSDINPHNVAKLSGIGCSSKTPAYWLSKSSGFNSIHGRMAPVATGAKIASRHLQVIGISGDGDTASIGLGGFVHLLRRNIPMLYIVANNGVYGLTKGQFSATSERGARQKSGEIQSLLGIDLCSLAIEIGCGFVARSFSGDAKQLVPLISAGLRHPGTAFIDVVSPCVTFANHEGSGRSYPEVKAHNMILQELGFIAPGREKTVDYPEGSTEEIELDDGSVLTLRKLEAQKHQLDDALGAQKALQEARIKGEILTGLFYWKSKEEMPHLLDQVLELTDRPLAQLSARETRPPESLFKQVLQEFR